MRPQTRMTRQRTVILEELRKMRTHPTADELYGKVRERIPRISLGTVYRNLDFLAESGKIRKLESAGSTRRFDGCIEPHQHVRCVRCGRVEDVDFSCPVPELSKVQAEGFHIMAVHVELEGLCNACFAAEKAATAHRHENTVSSDV